MQYRVHDCHKQTFDLQKLKTFGVLKHEDKIPSPGNSPVFCEQSTCSRYRQKFARIRTVD